MEYYENRLCISSRELVDGGVMSYESYKKMSARGRMDVVRRGGGPGQNALVSVDSLPMKVKEKVLLLHPDGALAKLKGWVLSNYEIDQAAVAFFHDKGKTGLDLTEEKVREYVVNASVLNCCIRLFNRARDCQKLFGGRYNWDRMAKVIEALKDEFSHTLPMSPLRFREKVNSYQRKGYASLINGRFGNQNTRKVSRKIERLVMSLSALPNKPYNTTTHENYLSFVTGELDVYDVQTGELFNPLHFRDKDGEPLMLSESTINNILNNPSNRALVEHALLSRNAFYHEQMPHVHRHGGDYSLSQVTMDDVDLTRKLKDTKQRVHAYYAYDVVSQCVVGAAYGRKKDERLVADCFRDMFRLIEKQGWGIPAGIEVENHLMSKYKEGLLLAGEVFKFVRFCAAQNSQEKYAEPLNGAKKRSVIHKNHEGIGRFYGKGKWRQEYEKVSDDTNETYEDKEYFSWEQLVEEDRRDSREWNHQLHPNQKKFPGMTRWQVLCERVNPHLLPYDKKTLSRYIGERVETSIRRNSTVRVCGEDWWLSGPEVLSLLEPNNMKVTACYLPDEHGRVTDVFIYQGDRYIDQVEKVETYSRVMAERTDDDDVKLVEQMKKISHFRRWVEENSVERVGTMPATVMADVRSTDADVVSLPPMEADGSANESWDDLLGAMDDAQAKGRALEDL